MTTTPTMHPSTLDTLQQAFSEAKKTIAADPQLVNLLLAAFNALVHALTNHAPPQQVADRAFALAVMSIHLAESHEQSHLPPPPKTA